MCCIPNKSSCAMRFTLRAGQEARSRRMAPTSLSFIASQQGQENLLLLARVAETWKCRPSDLLGIRIQNTQRTTTGRSGSSSKSYPTNMDSLTSFQFPVSNFPGANAPEMALQIDIAAAVALWNWRDELLKTDN